MDSTMAVSRSPPQLFTLFVGFVVLLLIQRIEANPSWSENVEYFKETTLKCSDTNASRVVQSVYFWILPSGNVLRPFSQSDESHAQLKDNGMTLVIDRVDDPDFGTYYCIVKINENETDVIKKGINIDGPYYGPGVVDGYKKDAIIGGIAAGCTLIIIITLCALCHYCKRKKHKDNANIEMGEAVSSTTVLTDVKQEHSNGTIQVGDGIYNMADEITTKPESKEDAFPVHDERFMSTESGHYQSIASLERNMKPNFGSETDSGSGFRDGLPARSVDEIYQRNVRSIHEVSSVPSTPKSEQGSVFETSSTGRDSWHDPTGELHGYTSASGIMPIQEQPFNEAALAAMPDDENALNASQNKDPTTVSDASDPIYAKPNRPVSKESTSVIRGEAIIEETGISVPVTSTVPIESTNTASVSSTIPMSEDEVFAARTEVVSETGAGIITSGQNPEVEIIPADTKQATTNTGSKSEDGQSETREEVDNPNPIKSSSSSQSSMSSSPKSDVDEETVVNYNSVLASIVSMNNKKSETGLDDRIADAETGVENEINGMDPVGVRKFHAMF